MSVIPGLLLTKQRAQGRVFVHPLLLVHLGPIFHHLWSIAYAFLLLTSHVVLVRQGIRENNSTPSACTLLGLGA